MSLLRRVIWDCRLLRFITNFDRTSDLHRLFEIVNIYWLHFIFLNTTQNVTQIERDRERMNYNWIGTKFRGNEENVKVINFIQMQFIMTRNDRSELLYEIELKKKMFCILKLTTAIYHNCLLIYRRDVMRRRVEGEREMGNEEIRKQQERSFNF